MKFELTRDYAQRMDTEDILAKYKDRFYKLKDTIYNPVLTVVLVTLVSAAFSVVAHLLRTAFGFPSTALLLVVLIIQLASTGGTYPPELLPTTFAWIGHIMPMTYSINAFRYTSKIGRSVV